MTPIAVSVEVGAEMINISATTLRSYIDQGLIPVPERHTARGDLDLPLPYVVTFGDTW